MRLTKKDYLEYYEQSDIFHSIMDEMGLNKSYVLNEKFNDRFDDLLAEINKTLSKPNYFDHVLILINELCNHPGIDDEALMRTLSEKVEDFALLHGSAKAISTILAREQRQLLNRSYDDGDAIFRRQAKINKYARVEQNIINSFLKKNEIKASNKAHNFCFKNYKVMRPNTMYTQIISYLDSNFKDPGNLVFCLTLNKQRFWSKTAPCFLVMQFMKQDEHASFTDFDCRLYEPESKKMTTGKLSDVLKSLLNEYVKNKKFLDWQMTRYIKM